jgi:CRP/FNR family transcriptional regulator, cyclic AMP receptor protein
VTDASTIEMLRSARIFAGLSDEELAQVASIASEVEFPTGFVLTESGQVGSGMFVLLEGRVSVHARGVEVELGPGEVIGELALLRRDMRRIARVQALTPVRCVAISREPFRALVASDVHLAVALLENLADRVPD